MSEGVFNRFTGYHNRRSIRLRGYDYSHPGGYFITICIHDPKQRLFGDVVDGKMVLNDAGKIAHQCWRDIPSHFPDVKLDEFIVMPNHIHGIIIIGNTKKTDDAGEEKIDGIPNCIVGVQNFEPLQYGPRQRHKWRGTTHRGNKYQHIIPGSVGSIVRGFKIGVSKWFREKSPGIVVWQRNFHDHIIRDENTFNFIKQYICDNPVKWNYGTDDLSPSGGSKF